MPDCAWEIFVPAFRRVWENLPGPARQSLAISAFPGRALGTSEDLRSKVSARSGDLRRARLVDRRGALLCWGRGW